MLTKFHVNIFPQYGELRSRLATALQLDAGDSVSGTLESFITKVINHSKQSGTSLLESKCKERWGGGVGREGAPATKTYIVGCLPKNVN